MFTRTTIALAIMLGTAAAAQAAAKHHANPSANDMYVNRANDVYDGRGVFVGSDPDPTVRSGLRRDGNLGQY